MERLSDKARLYARSYGQPPYGREIEGTAKLLLQMADKLEEYEDLEEQGKLLKLPCAVGDWVYKIKDGWVNYYKVARIEVDGNKESDVYFKSSCDPEKWPFCTLDDFGKTVFLTCEEAEAVLKEL